MRQGYRDHRSFIISNAELPVHSGGSGCGPLWPCSSPFCGHALSSDPLAELWGKQSQQSNCWKTESRIHTIIWTWTRSWSNDVHAVISDLLMKEKNFLEVCSCTVSCKRDNISWTIYSNLSDRCILHKHVGSWKACTEGRDRRIRDRNGNKH